MHLLGRETISNKLFWLIFLGGQFPKPCWANVGTFVVCVEHALVPLGGPVAELSWNDFFKTFLLMFFLVIIFTSYFSTWIGLPNKATTSHKTLH